jgi:hypothetical protein
MRWTVGRKLAIVTVCALAIGPKTLRATPRTPDVLVLDGRAYDLLVNPLERYFADGRLVVSDVRSARGSPGTSSSPKARSSTTSTWATRPHTRATS